MSELLKLLLAPYMVSRSFVVEDAAGGEGTEAVQLTGGDAVGTGNDERIARLNAIANQNDIDQEDQLGDVNDDGTTTPFQAEKPEAAEESVVEETEPTEAVAEEPAPVVVTKHKIKVNGREIELTTEELIARAQKVESADEYLRTASQARKEATTKLVGPSQDDLRRLQDEEDQALVRALQVGTPEEATAAIRKIRAQAGERPSFTQDDVSRTIDERLAFNTAITAYRTEYDDIVSDPFLDKLALDRDAELLGSGDTRPYLERYREIGEELRTWVKSKTPATKVEDVGMDARKEKKAAVPKIPASASAKTRAPVAEPDEDDTPSTTIAAMAHSRGGPQWMRN
jgi:hypothetical protein